METELRGKNACSLVGHMTVHDPAQPASVSNNKLGVKRSGIEFG